MILALLIPTQGLAASLTTYSLTYDLVYRVSRASDFTPTEEMLERGFPVFDDRAVLRDSIDLSFTVPDDASYPFNNYGNEGFDFELSCTFAQGDMCLTLNGASFHINSFNPRTAEISFNTVWEASYIVDFDLFRGGSKGLIGFDHEWFGDCYMIIEGCDTGVAWFDFEVLAFNVRGLPRPPEAIPLPATLPLLAFAFVGFGIAARKRRGHAQA